MKLQQLRYILEVSRHNLNISEAADAVFTSQPGVSKQIRLLEEELGIQIFIRSGKRIVATTAAGDAVLSSVERIFKEVRHIQNIGSEFSGSLNTQLTLATTHVFARYRLPETLAAFMKLSPDARIRIKQGTPAQIAEMVHNGTADLAVGAASFNTQYDIKLLPCGAWQYIVCVPHGHRLASRTSLTLQDIADYPLLTYPAAMQSGGTVANAFLRAGLEPDTALLSDDSELLKTYAGQGLGIALLDNHAYHPEQDNGLHAIAAHHLFEYSENAVMLRRDTLIRSDMYTLIALLNPALTRDKVDQLMHTPAIEDFSI